MMELGYDPEKNARNIRERGLSFDDVALLDWSTAIERQDTRKDYGEARFQACVRGPDSKPYIVVYTVRGATMWVISFRRANTRESRSYGKKT
jgi:uncharacterized DUF497 family protein